MNAIYILWLRELKRYTRSRAMVVASLGQPLLYLLVLGFGAVEFSAFQQYFLDAAGHRAMRIIFGFAFCMMLAMNCRPLLCNHPSSQP